ncbi:hypothetical protein [Deinococcus yavapaiensis]|uniref:Uncharacterized protein n=1 Tax=Deinococcus yavapaiensis KR-236 TaxID=694435 RepID=A0A318RZN8_9DEIO|nr:hypothetical protein [Deinococcus yavapaiensis]PYE49874.1 hypothetical protein DES52_1213 [Deinococcus yavapaiensis KR-236]
MKRSILAIAFFATTAFAAGPTVIPIDRIQEENFTDPCTGETVTGTTYVTGEERRFEDANGGFHIVIQVFFRGTYTGSSGTTYTGMTRSRLTVNGYPEGRLAVVDLGTGHLTSSDGTKTLDRGRFALVIDSNGNVRVERSNEGPICIRN